MIFTDGSPCEAVHAQRLLECALVDDTSPGDVDEKRAWLQESELGLANQVARCVRQRAMKREDVEFGQECLE